MSAKVEIPASRKKFFLALLISIGFVITGLIMGLVPEDFESVPIGESKRVILGFSIAVIFAGAGLFSIIKLTQIKAGISFDEAGITDHLGGMSVGLVRWENIEGFGVNKHVGNKFIVVYLNNSEELMAAQSTLKRRLLQENIAKFNSPVAISTTMLKVKFEEAKEIFESEGAKRGIQFH